MVVYKAIIKESKQNQTKGKESFVFGGFFCFVFLRRSRKEEAPAGRRLSFNLKLKVLLSINVELYPRSRYLLMTDNVSGWVVVCGFFTVLITKIIRSEFQ